jgi:cytochrome c-type biogenesis protein CcmH/NrfF
MHPLAPHILPAPFRHPAVDAGHGGPAPTTSALARAARRLADLRSVKAFTQPSLALVALLLALGIAPLLASPAAGLPARTTLPAVEGQVMCVTCKIPLLIAQSPEASRERAFIQRLIDEGRTEGQIKRALVREYGPAVLALPPAHGVGLAAYLVPIALLLAVLGALALLLPRWRGRARANAALGAADGSLPSTLSPADAARLDADIARFD